MTNGTTIQTDAAVSTNEDLHHFGNSALHGIRRKLAYWHTQVIRDPDCTNAKIPFVIVKKSMVSIEELKTIPGYIIVEYKSFHFPYRQIHTRRDATIDIERPTNCYVAVKKVGNGCVKVSALMRNV